jgi:Cu-Zn family superoxide dismutase
MRIRTIAAVGAAATLTMLLPGMAWGSSGADVVRAEGSLTAYDNPYGTGAANPTAGGAARVHAVANSSGEDGKTIVTLHVTGLAPNREFGSHVHILACGDNKAGGHYRNDPAGPATPDNEIWLDFTTNGAGSGRAQAVVDWTIRPGGAKAVIIHDHETEPGGAAGPKLACLDVAF